MGLVGLRAVVEIYVDGSGLWLDRVLDLYTQAHLDISYILCSAAPRTMQPLFRSLETSLRTGQMFVQARHLILES